MTISKEMKAPKAGGVKHPDYEREFRTIHVL